MPLGELEKEERGEGALYVVECDHAAVSASDGLGVAEKQVQFQQAERLQARQRRREPRLARNLYGEHNPDSQVSQLHWSTCVAEVREGVIAAQEGDGEQLESEGGDGEHDLEGHVPGGRHQCAVNR